MKAGDRVMYAYLDEPEVGLKYGQHYTVMGVMECKGAILVDIGLVHDTGFTRWLAEWKLENLMLCIRL